MDKSKIISNESKHTTRVNHLTPKEGYRKGEKKMELQYN
jgi:hypothetical protein